MSFYYKLQPVSDNINKKDPVKGLMAMAIRLGTIDLDELAKSIARRSTFSAPEVKGILDAMVAETENYLSLGYNVSMADLGTFSVSAKAKIVQSPGEIRGTSIEMKRIVHRPSRAMTKRLKSVPFELVVWEKSTGRKKKKEEGE